jgi:hypothetical protein
MRAAPRSKIEKTEERELSLCAQLRAPIARAWTKKVEHECAEHPAWRALKNL